MIILQINTVDTRGGAAQVAYNLKRELERRGHQSSMFVGRKYSENPNIKLLNDVRSFFGKARRKLVYWLANDIDVFSSDHIFKTPEFKKADIIHCHNLHSYYFNLSTLKKIARLKPVIWTFHDMWPITAHCAHSFGGAIKESGFFTCPNLDIYPPIAWHNEKYLENRKTKIYQKSKFHIVVPSQWLADKVKQSILKDRPLSVIYNGIDTSIFKPHNKQECRQFLDLPMDKRIIIIVAKRGKSNPWKGGSYVQNAITALMDNLSVFFVDLGGDANQTNNRVRMVGYVSNQEILAKYYSAADMLLYPSIADNCPLIILEAQACGLPVVTFKTGGIPELIDHQKTGYAVRYKDTNDLIAGIQWVLNRSPQEHFNMRQAAIEKINSGFTLEKMTDQYLSLYKKEIEGFNL